MFCQEAISNVLFPSFTSPSKLCTIYLFNAILKIEIIYFNSYVFSCSQFQVPKNTDHKKYTQQPYRPCACNYLIYTITITTQNSMPYLVDRKYYFLSSTFIHVHSQLSRIPKVSFCGWIYIHTHTQYIRSHNTADNRGLISVWATTNSGKLLGFKFWHEIACQLSPSLLFPAQADSFGWLPSLLGQTWGSTAEQRHRTCPIHVWWGLSQVMESKPSESFSQREGQIRKNLGL